MTSQNKALILVGPTASGKTAVSLAIAELMPSEILSADSRQLFRHMDIGTAKPTREERDKVQHYGIDLCEPSDYFSAGEYSKYGRKIIDDIIARNHTPIVVGGSGLYIQALVEGIFTGNYRDSNVRNRLKATIVENGIEYSYKRLQSIDPDYAEKIHPNDSKRIVRALEVYELTGQPFSTCHERTVRAEFTPVYFGLLWSREQLVQRIHQRVDQMIEAGLVDEVQSLLDAGHSPELNSLNSVGYKEIIAYLQKERSLKEAIELIKRNTRRFSKRQMTWFRKNPAIHWIECQDDVDWSMCAQMIVDHYMKSF